MTRGAAEFEVSSVGGGRRGRGPGVAAAAVVVAIGLLMGGGLLSSALFPPPPTETPPPSGPGPVPTPGLPLDTPGPLAPTNAPAPLLTMRPATRPLDVSALVAGVLDGSYADKVILVSGRLRATPQRGCSIGGAPSACVSLRIDGLRGLKVVPDMGLGVWAGEPAPGAVLALRVAGRDLVYLGSLVVSDGGIPGVGYLTGDFNAPGSTLSPPTNLVEADGLLATNKDAGCLGSVTSCGRPAPQLLPTTQLGASAAWYGAAIDVTVAPNAPGVNAADDWTQGLFLLRRLGADPGWEIVAREALNGMVSIILP